jgi:O-antigen/teichoic acid export membrane protein
VAAATVLAVLAPALLHTSLNRLYNHALIGLGENRWYFLVSSGGAGLNVLGNLVLIPLWGIYGAAVMTVVTEGAVLVGSRLKVESRLREGTPAAARPVPERA